MRTETVTYYEYDELPTDKAKEKAREWFRDISAGDNFWSEVETDDFVDVLRAAGFAFNPERYLSWSGFSSQGDGAAFTADWYAGKCDVAALIADRPLSCDANARLVPILESLAELARKFPQSRGSTEASQRGHYQLETTWGSGDDDDDMDAATIREHTETFTEACKDLARHLYLSLEAEYEYQNSNEAAVESIRANRHEFDETGRRV